MRTPSHWKSKNLLSELLLPIATLYGLATALRLCLKTSQKVSKPVICIGNLTAGGTGKTPIAISIAELLQDCGKNPCFVSRGYGGKLKGIFVDSQKHSAAQVGDEPLLLARQAPVVINPNRYLGATKAIKSGADVIIMDDGFQNPSLHKDLSFIVIDGEFGLGNELCIPSGPLREFVCAGIKRANAIIIVGTDKHNLASRWPNLPVFGAKITPQRPQTDNSNVIAFAGIGRPQKFYQSLQDCGFNLIQTIDFADHHFYQEAELTKIMELAKQKQAKAYTTAKDFVKIPAHLQEHFNVLEIEITWSEPERLSDFILSHLDI